MDTSPEDEVSAEGGVIGPVFKPYEVAKIFRVSRETVNRWANSGRLPSHRTLGGHRRYAKADVIKLYLENGGRFDPNWHQRAT